jgi:hypothetical protein
MLFVYARQSCFVQTPAHGNLISRSMTAPAACVIAQQYSSTLVSLRFLSRKEKFGACQKCYD